MNATFSNQYFTARKPAYGLRINLNVINKFLGLAIVASFIMCLIGNNDLAVKGFVLKDYKNKASQLELQNKELEGQIASLDSYSYLSQKAQEFKLVKATNIKYWPANNQILARR